MAYVLTEGKKVILVSFTKISVFNFACITGKLKTVTNVYTFELKSQSESLAVINESYEVAIGSSQGKFNKVLDCIIV